jgi:hypothetical protein
MILRIATDLALALDDSSDFKRFKVLVQRPQADFAAVASHSGKVLSFQDARTAWVSAESLIALSGFSEDAAWRDAFDGMLLYCKKMGWLSDDGREFRAHVEWISSGPAFPD